MRKFRLPCLALIFLSIAASPRAGELTPPTGDQMFVAKVDTAAVTFDQIVELWGGAWYRTLCAVRSGTLDCEAGDRKLQEEWGRALDSAVREEVFFQEATRSFEQNMLARIDAIYEAQNSHRNSDRMPRSMVDRMVREQFERVRRRNLDLMSEHYIRESGGAAKLKATLEQKGISWPEWLRRLERKAFTRGYLSEFITSPVEPRPADVRQYYQDHPEEFTRPGEIKFRHILFSADQRGGETAARVAAGNVYQAIVEQRISFEEAASKHSDDAPSKARGGLEQGIADDPEREAWLADLRDAIRNEKPGQIGPILVSPIGSHLVMLLKKADDNRIPFQQVQKQIVDQMQMREEEKKSRELFEELKAQVKIIILMPNFPKKYSCARSLRQQFPAYRVGPLAEPGLQDLP